MTETSIRIELPPDELRELAQYVNQHLPPDTTVVPIQNEQEGYRLEPVTIALILLTTAAVKGVAKVLNTWLEQKGQTDRARLKAAMQIRVNDEATKLEDL